VPVVIPGSVLSWHSQDRDGDGLISYGIGEPGCAHHMLFPCLDQRDGLISDESPIHQDQDLCIGFITGSDIEDGDFDRKVRSQLMISGKGNRTDPQIMVMADHGQIDRYSDERVLLI